MKYTVLRTEGLTPELQRVWGDMRAGDAALASPYFHPAFTRAVGAVRSDVYVTVAEDAGEVRAFFPFQRSRLGVGRAVGGAMSDYHGLVGRNLDGINARDLLRGSGLTSWSFDHCIASQGVFSGFQRVTASSPVMDLSRGYERYAAQRREAGSKQILKAEGLARKLEREHGELRFEPVVREEGLLEKCIAWKRAHYAEMGVFDVLRPEWTRELLKRIFAVEEPGFAGMLSTLHAGERLIAVHMGMRSERVWHYWFPTYDAELAKYSPGIILLLRMAGTAENLRLTSIDLGKGATLYKDRLANAENRIAEGIVELPGLMTSIRKGRASLERYVRGSPMRAIARYPARAVRRTEKWLRFR